MAQPQTLSYQLLTNAPEQQEDDMEQLLKDCPQQAAAHYLVTGALATTHCVPPTEFPHDAP